MREEEEEVVVAPATLVVPLTISTATALTVLSAEAAAVVPASTVVRKVTSPATALSHASLVRVAEVEEIAFGLPHFFDVFLWNSY